MAWWRSAGPFVGRSIYLLLFGQTTDYREPRAHPVPHTASEPSEPFLASRLLARGLADCKEEASLANWR
jgi:hypothetical protein